MSIVMSTVLEEELASSDLAPSSAYLAWTPSVAGALIAAAFSTVLVAFGTAIGLGVASTAPTWRDASAALWLLSGIYLILVALISFGIGGYVAGRIRVNTAPADQGETERRDGLHGLAAWAMAIVLTVLIAALIAGAASRSTATQTALQTAPSTTAAEPLLSYELDRLFRPTRRNANVETAQERAEAGRILLTSGSHSGVSADDRTYLVQMVGAVTGLSAQDAERRVDNVMAAAKTAIARSRRSSVIAAFSIAASALLGAVVAWLAACEGGRQRDGAAPEWLPGQAFAPRTRAF